MSSLNPPLKDCPLKNATKLKTLIVEDGLNKIHLGRNNNNLVEKNLNQALIAPHKPDQKSHSQHLSARSGSLS